MGAGIPERLVVLSIGDDRRSGDWPSAGDVRLEAERGQSPSDRPCGRAHAQIIGRISKDRRRQRPAHRPVEVLRLPRVAAEQPVLSHAPQIALPRDRCIWDSRKRASSGPGGEDAMPLKQRIDLGRFEACNRNVETRHRRQVDQFAKLKSPESRDSNQPACSAILLSAMT
jgi:hypothetical protein